MVTKFEVRRMIRVLTVDALLAIGASRDSVWCAQSMSNGIVGRRYRALVCGRYRVRKNVEMIRSESRWAVFLGGLGWFRWNIFASRCAQCQTAAKLNSQAN